MTEGQKKGRPPPDWYLAKPEIDPAEHLYLDAFWRLSTGRAMSDQVLGPIPWSDIMYFADREGFDPQMTDLFERTIMEMDNGYLLTRGAEMRAAAERRSKTPQASERRTLTSKAE